MTLVSFFSSINTMTCLQYDYFLREIIGMLSNFLIGFFEISLKNMEKNVILINIGEKICQIESIKKIIIWILQKP